MARWIRLRPRICRVSKSLNPAHGSVGEPMELMEYTNALDESLNP